MNRFFRDLLILNLVFFCLNSNASQEIREIETKSCPIISDGFTFGVLYGNEVLPSTVVNKSGYKSVYFLEEFIEDYKKLQEFGFCPEKEKVKCSLKMVNNLPALHIDENFFGHVFFNALREDYGENFFSRDTTNGIRISVPEHFGNEFNLREICSWEEKLPKCGIRKVSGEKFEYFFGEDHKIEFHRSEIGKFIPRLGRFSRQFCEQSGISWREIWDTECEVNSGNPYCD